MLLLEAIDARQEGAQAGASEIQEMVAAAGFGEKDMQELLGWLQSRWEPAMGEPAWLATRQVNRVSDSALRQMSPDEDDLLTPDAFGYLLDLVRTRQITAEQMESLIQFAQLAPDGPLTVVEIESLMERVVFAPVDGRTVAAGHFGRAH